MIVIDGTNLLWAVKELPGDREITTEVHLCRALDRYFALTGENGEIIFDGAGPADKSVFDGVVHLEIVFSGFNMDADTVIEEKILANTAPRRLTVVSSDRRLRVAAAARGATALKSELFWERVTRESRRKRPQKQEPEEKRGGLTESETDKWLDLFGL
jgi:predicted RNA-binding protein with PIN domain